MQRMLVRDHLKRWRISRSHVPMISTSFRDGHNARHILFSPVYKLQNILGAMNVQIDEKIPDQASSRSFC